MGLRQACARTASVALGSALMALAPAPALGASGVGIDVSRFQGSIDWTRVGETRVEFAFLQASRGSGQDCAVAPDRCGADEFYERNHRLATQVGIRVGAYHRAFAGGRGRKSARRDARAEADVFIARVGSLREGDLRPALDLESPFGRLNARRLRVWVRTWLKRVRNELGSKPIIYTNVASWRATGDTTKFARTGHPLWVANWGVSSPAVPADNWNGQGWSIWQYTSSGRVKGIAGRVDKNRLGVGFDRISVG
jgi:GH25 family lysozyme M1 (1,4-beta-N-acetylmuramidase)